MQHPVYRHTQGLWLAWVLLPAAAVAVGAPLFASEGTAGWAGAALVVAVHATLLLVLGRFTVEVGEGHVEWRFGFVGRPRWRLALDEIVGVEVATSSWLEGWGIRRTRTGMLYNAQGLQAVRLRLRDGRTLRLGSDEPERLAAFIAARLSAPPQVRPVAR